MRPVLTRGQKRRTRRAGLAGAEGTGREGDSGIVRRGFTSANTGEQEARAAQEERVGIVCRSRGMFWGFFIIFTGHFIELLAANSPCLLSGADTTSGK